MDKVLKLENGQYDLIETVSYPNGGASYFYVRDQQAIIIDDGICNYKKDEKLFSYSLITDKQNTYMNKYAKVYRFLKEDMGIINEVITLPCKKEEIPIKYVANREDHADASPLEIDFENNFASVYGRNSLKYLQKEYGILDEQGNNYFLDYLLRTKHGDYAVEENGVTYHHPQQIGLERYRRQLQKQNTCTEWGIKLYRFSSEDCRFENRIEDDIKTFFGENTDEFEENGILADRPVKLYEHQENTLEEIQKQRAAGINTFLVVFPTASGKSRIVEEDLRIFSRKNTQIHALISHWAFVWEYWCHTIVYKHFCYRRSFITSVNNTVFHSNICKLIIKTFKSSAVMFVSWIYCEIDNPSVFITGSFNPIGKHMLMFALSEPSAFRICCTALNSFSV